jgi:thymidylate synthase (FAD)
MSYPVVHSPVFRTISDTPYLRGPGVVVLSAPHVDLSGMRPFLIDFGMGFENYLDDPTDLPDCEKLIKVAGQLCYFSFGEKRTKNDQAQAYFDHIKEGGHGSVLEHANISLLLYGVDRATTHEIVRHRAGWGFSQVSQRFVDGKTLRFVERPEFQAHAGLHQLFKERIDRVADEYGRLADVLLTAQKDGLEVLSEEGRTALRKKVNQAARAALTNETEAPIIVTGNLRAVRHKVEMRANKGADLPIRQLAVNILECVRPLAPRIMADHEVESLSDGTVAVNAKFRKV